MNWPLRWRTSVAAAASSISAVNVLLRWMRCMAPLVVELIPAIARDIVILLKQVRLIDVGANMLPVQIEHLLRVGCCQKLPVFRALAGERHAGNLIRYGVACHAPFAVFVLSVTAAVSGPPSLLITGGLDLHEARECRPRDILLDRVRRWRGLQRVEKLMPGSVIRKARILALARFVQ